MSPCTQTFRCMHNPSMPAAHSHLQEPYRWGPVQSGLAETPSGLAAPPPLVRRQVCPRGLLPGCQSPAEDTAPLAGKPRARQSMLHITVLQRLSPHCTGPCQGESCQRRHSEPSQAETSILQAQQAVQAKMRGFCSVICTAERRPDAASGAGSA